MASCFNFFKRASCISEDDLKFVEVSIQAKTHTLEAGTNELGMAPASLIENGRNISRRHGWKNMLKSNCN